MFTQAVKEKNSGTSKKKCHEPKCESGTVNKNFNTCQNTVPYNPYSSLKIKE